LLQQPISCDTAAATSCISSTAAGAPQLMSLAVGRSAGERVQLRQPQTPENGTVPSRRHCSVECQGNNYTIVFMGNFGHDVLRVSLFIVQCALYTVNLIVDLIVGYYLYSECV